MPPKSFSHFQILAPLGVGGMGEVYRARDTHLGRDVAVKVLPEGFARDPERLARFQREAQLLAALNHPNIAAVYGLEEAEGERCLILEYVPGETLADRLAHGPLPLDEALTLARQMTEALEAAHERGIVHRDLKPTNIKITPDGKVKVLDFGLAKDMAAAASSGDASRSPTLSAAATRAGVILGTAAYMSPEQARGRPLDKRSDIWSFGCVLFEMLSGRQAFPGETTSDAIASILRTEPDWKALPAGTPAGVTRLLRRCLEKDAMRRQRDIADARLEIDEVLAGPPSSEAAIAVAVSRPGGRRVSLWALMGLAAGLAAVALLSGIWLQQRRMPPAAHWSGDLLGGPSLAIGPRISPDGRTVAFQAFVDNVTQVAVMNPDSGNWTILTHERGKGFVTELAWSRDSSKIYFDRTLDQPKGVYTIPALGGEERLVLEAASSPEPLPDGSLLVARVNPERRAQIFRYWPDSGRLQGLEAYPEPAIGSQFRVSPDGKEAVFLGSVVKSGSDAVPHLFALDLATGEARRLAPELPIVRTSLAFPIAVTADSVITEFPAGNLHQIIAIPRRGPGPVRRLMALTEGVWYISVATDGSLYLDQISRPLEILRFSVAGGTPEVLGISESYPPAYSQPVELPDRRYLLPSLASGHARLLAGGPGKEYAPLVDTEEETQPPATRVGENDVAFMIGTGASRTIALASASDGRIIRRLQGTLGVPVDFLAASPDGKWIYYVSSGMIWAIPSADGSPRKIHAGDGLAVSPNGREIVVNLNETQGVRLVRVSLEDGAESPLSLPAKLRASALSLGAGAYDTSGRLLVGVVPEDSWFFAASVMNLKNGGGSRIPLNFAGDVFYLGWGRDGRALAVGEPLRAHLWRFRPVS